VYDVAVIGAGAAGLMAAIFAGRAGKRVIALDGAPKIGAKILISGGGRCNVTHDVVRPEDFNGNRNAIAKVLRAFDVERTVAFFEELGVPLKREETGKLFPVSDRARDVVEALLRAAREANVEVRTGFRVQSIVVRSSFFVVRAHEERTTKNEEQTEHLILATGGRSVPKSGSDGSGYALARVLGHTITPVFPALVPLIVKKDHWSMSIGGTSVDAELAVKSPTGRVLHRERGAMLFTHFGLSGPAVLDISRHFIAAQPATLSANFLPGETFESVEASLLAHENPHATLASILRRRLPDRLVAQIASDVPLNRLSKEERRRAIRNVIDCALPVERDRGFDYAEVTAGGVPLSEVDVSTMRSRVCDRLSLVGEILDVDGKIGGFNFQWAWATGFIAGTGP
jgi:predicted Rossmann fold flavoprotein